MRMMLTGLATIAVGSPRIWRKLALFMWRSAPPPFFFGWLAIRLWVTYLPPEPWTDSTTSAVTPSAKPPRPSSVPRSISATRRTGPPNGPGGAPVRCCSQKSLSEAIRGGATPEDLRLRGDHHRRRDRVVTVARQPLEGFRRWGRRNDSMGQFADWLSGRQDDGHSPRRP